MRSTSISAVLALPGNNSPITIRMTYLPSAV